MRFLITAALVALLVAVIAFTVSASNNDQQPPALHAGAGAGHCSCCGTGGMIHIECCDGCGDKDACCGSEDLKKSIAEVRASEQHQKQKKQPDVHAGAGAGHCSCCGTSGMIHIECCDGCGDKDACCGSEDLKKSIAEVRAAGKH